MHFRFALIPSILALLALAPPAVLADELPTASPPAQAAPSVAQGTNQAATPPSLAAAIPLTSYVPSSALFVAGVDSKWLWDATADVRQTHSVKAQLSEAEAVLNLSPDADIMPWLGRTYIAIIPGASETSDPRFVVYAEIRDEGAYAAATARIKAAISLRPHVNVTTVQVDGKDVVKVTGADKKLPQVIFLADGGWVILSLDGNAIHKVLDTLTGAYSNMTTKPTFAKAFAKADGAGNAAMWGALSFDFQSFMGGLAKGKEGIALPKPGSVQAALAKGALCFTVTDGGTSLREDSTTFQDDPKAQDYMEKMRVAFKPITGESFEHMPQGTFVSVVGVDPMAWINFIQSSLTQSGVASNPLAYLNIVAVVNSYAPFLGDMTGEFNLGGAVRDGKFGVTLILRAGSQQTADQAATDLVAELKQFQVPVTKSGDMYTLTGMPEQSEFPLSPSIRAVDGYLKIATAKQWLTPLPGDTPTLLLPREAVGASYAFVQNFKFVDDLVALANKEKTKDPDETKFLAGIQQLHLSNTTWTGWGKVDVGGATGTGALVLDNLDWKAAIKLVVELGMDEPAKSFGHTKG